MKYLPFILIALALCRAGCQKPQPLFKYDGTTTYYDASALRNEGASELIQAMFKATGIPYSTSTENGIEAYTDGHGNLHINPNSYTEGFTFASSGVRVGPVTNLP